MSPLPVSCVKRYCDPLDRGEHHEPRQRDREHRPPVPAVELAGATEQLTDRPLVPQGRDVDRAPAGKKQRHHDQQQQGHTQADRADGRLRLQVDELGDARDRAAEGRGRPGPSTAPPGSRGLVWRIPSIQVKGRSHCFLVVGPCGPLLNPFSRWPQWPRKLSHWNSLPAAAAVGTMIGRGSVRISGSGCCRSRRPTRVSRSRCRSRCRRKWRGIPPPSRRPGAFPPSGPWVVPIGALAPGVLEEGDLRWPLRERLGGRVGVEGDLHPLPVALMDVVELVEVVEEPVLHDQARVARLGGDVGVGDRGRLAVVPQRLEVLRVAAALGAFDVERIARQVEVVVVTQPGDVRGSRARLDRDVLPVDVMDQLDRGFPSTVSTVVGGLYCSSVVSQLSACRLLAEHHDRRVRRDELLLRGGTRRARRSPRRERGGRREDEERRQPSGSAHHGATLTRARMPNHRSGSPGLLLLVPDAEADLLADDVASSSLSSSIAAAVGSTLTATSSPSTIWSSGGASSVRWQADRARSVLPCGLIRTSSRRGRPRRQGSANACEASGVIVSTRLTSSCREREPCRYPGSPGPETATRFDDRDRAPRRPVLNWTTPGGAKIVVAADADAVARAEAGTALAHDDLAAAHRLPANTLTPSYFGLESRPLRLEPSPFL